MNEYIFSCEFCWLIRHYVVKEDTDIGTMAVNMRVIVFQSKYRMEFLRVLGETLQNS